VKPLKPAPAPKPAEEPPAEPTPATGFVAEPGDESLGDDSTDEADEAGLLNENHTDDDIGIVAGRDDLPPESPASSPGESD